jgi:uncharacterized protein involved in exopolysaccharide biosynthesis
VAEQLDHQEYEVEINILDYWRIIVKRKKLISIIVSLAFIVSVIVSFILPEIYTSKSSILSTKTHINQWIDILKSQSLRDTIIERFDLRTAYNVKTSEAARNTLIDNVKITKTAGNTINLAIEDRIPKRAAQLTNAFVEELVNINKTVIMSNSKRKRIYLERSLEASKAKLADAENSAKEFQEMKEAVKLDGQTSSLFDTIVFVEGQLLTKEVELQTLLMGSEQESLKTEILRTEITALKARLNNLNEAFIPMFQLNPLGLNYSRLLRELRVQEKHYLYLSNQLEVTRLEEVKNSPTIQVLDRALVPEMKSKPKRKRMVILSVFLSVFLSFFLVLIIEYVAHIKETMKIEERG